MQSSNSPLLHEAKAWVATIPPNVEDIAASEIETLGGVEIVVKPRAVHFSASEAVALNIVMWARLPSRLLEPLTTFACDSAEALYAGVSALPWEARLTSQMTFRVHATQGKNFSPNLNNTHFVSLVVKDAVVDRCREHTGERPDVAHDAPPDVHLMLHLENFEASLSIDVGGALHRRGAERPGALAPLRENLAAAILMRSAWDKKRSANNAFLDPMCGSGTLVLEAASMAADQAPGLYRQIPNLKQWTPARQALWRDAEQAARARFQEGLRAARDAKTVLVGLDQDRVTVRFARARAEALGLDAICLFRAENFLGTEVPLKTGRETFVVTNPPYGRRLGEEQNIFPLYAQLGQALKRLPEGSAHLIVDEQTPASALGLRAHKRHKLSNGGISCTLHHFLLRAPALKSEGPTVSSGAQMLAARLKKNLKRLAVWRTQQRINCFRVYDADLPEYALAIDIYGEWAHVQEYAPPKTIDPQKRTKRLREAMTILPQALNIAPDHIILKVRDRQRGSGQYGREQGDARRFCVVENEMRFWVDLTTYLDTGYFFDHREVRAEIRARAFGKRFLNLFGYTCTMTVAAAAGGARSSISVDASQTYLAWAEQNFAENQMEEDRHRVIRADAVLFSQEVNEIFDLIFVNPPVFSNSKRFDDIFSIQEDHSKLLTSLADKLSPQGTIVFTTHAKKFVLSEDLAMTYEIRERTRDWTPHDFDRKSPPFRGWEFRLHKAPVRNSLK